MYSHIQVQNNQSRFAVNGVLATHDNFLERIQAKVEQGGGFKVEIPKLLMEGRWSNWAVFGATYAISVPFSRHKNDIKKSCLGTLINDSGHTLYVCEKPNEEVDAIIMQSIMNDEAANPYYKKIWHLGHVLSHMGLA